MNKFAMAALVGGILALGGVSAVSAQSAQAVEHSGRVFHIRACPTFEGPQSARCFAHIVTDSRGNILMSNVTRNATPGRLFACAASREPTASPASGSLDNDGRHRRRLWLSERRVRPGDLPWAIRPWDRGTTRQTIVNQTGGTRPPKTNVGWAQETALDLDMVSTMCPNCKILLVQASSASYANLGAAVNYAASQGAHVISNSYGGCENGSSGYDTYYNHAGVAVTASTGDSGYGAQFPATSEWVIAAGGTSLTMSNTTRGWSETVWSGGGSGCSKVYAKPAWQHDRYTCAPAAWRPTSRPMPIPIPASPSMAGQEWRPFSLVGVWRHQRRRPAGRRDLRRERRTR